MSKKIFKVIDNDIIYLSYDEPNAEKNYNDLLQKIPWAKRVHGVKGSDSAHKACAELSETERFITVDGDNRIDQEFLNVELEIDNIDQKVISWAGENVINGLIYGNGGLKSWPKEFVLKMKTHENADPDDVYSQIEFCWNVDYLQMNKCYSKIYNNGSSLQAWRAGFREGVKMALDRGQKPSLDNFKKNYWQNLHRLYIWCMIGSDVENGLYAILGARQGLYKTMCTDWDYVNVRDFDYLNNLWNEIQIELENNSVLESIKKIGLDICRDLSIPIAENPLDKDQSLFFKKVYMQPDRVHRTIVNDK